MENASLYSKVAKKANMDLHGKVAIVTGASQGIGAAIAMGLASRGASVAVNYFKNEQKAAGVASEIAAQGGQAMAVQADVSDRASVDEMVKRVLDAYGRVDILVNNAGDVVARGPFTDLGWDVWEKVINLDLKGVVNCCQAVVPLYKEQKGGRIINIVSELVCGGWSNYTPYVAAKSAVIGLTKTLAMELGDGITTNAVAPGITRTDLNARLGVGEGEYEGLASANPLGRIGELEDIVAAVVYLASDGGAYSNGTTIFCNGGIVRPTP